MRWLEAATHSVLFHATPLNAGELFARQIEGARQALDDGFGDCEELTSLFVAMCRAVGIPARCVWVPGHCYPEFYLEDKEGKGHWFPCQAAGSPAFGGIPEKRPGPGNRTVLGPDRQTGRLEARCELWLVRAKNPCSAYCSSSSRVARAVVSKL